MREFGIVQPVILFPQKAEFLAVCGFRRVQAAKGAGMMRIPALVSRGLERKQTVLLSLLERLSHGPLNNMERARSVEKFSQNGWLKQEIGRYLFPLLELKFNAMVLDQLAALLGLPPEVQTDVASGEIHLYTAHRLAQWAPYELQIGRWFSDLKLGVNKQRELLGLMDDVARVCNVEKASLVQDLEEIRSRAEPVQVYDAWLQTLKSRRYPRFNEAQRQFEENKARFHLPGQIQIISPPFFEESRYKVSFPFGSREELELHCRKLLEIAETPEMEAILRLI